jgi:hypothetical protein
MKGTTIRIGRKTANEGYLTTAAEETHKTHLMALLDPYLEHVVVQHPGACRCGEAGSLVPAAHSVSTRSLVYWSIWVEAHLRRAMKAALETQGGA